MSIARCYVCAARSAITGLFQNLRPILYLIYSITSVISVISYFLLLGPVLCTVCRGTHACQSHHFLALPNNGRLRLRLRGVGEPRGAGAAQARGPEGTRPPLPCYFALFQPRKLTFRLLFPAFCRFFRLKSNSRASTTPRAPATRPGSWPPPCASAWSARWGSAGTWSWAPSSPCSCAT